MSNIHVTEALEMRWVPVLDARGREHLEARWSLAPEQSEQAQPTLSAPDQTATRHGVTHAA